MSNDSAPRAFDLRDLDYDLPAERIAQVPAARREDAGMLTIDRATRSVSDRRITDLPDLLHAGDLLVLNNSRVLPAKFYARRPSGGRVKGLFLHSPSAGIWEVLLESSRRLRPGETITAARGDHRPAFALELLERLDGGRWLLSIDDEGAPESVLNRIGHTPLPPYIRRKPASLPAGRTAAPAASEEEPDRSDRERYQTVYAAVPGSVAAPTAGLHLTEPLLERIRARGVHTAFVTLHVGLGTFKPISVDRIADHAMHSEIYELPAATADAINACRARGGRVVAVGTTTVRTLESAALAATPTTGPVPSDPLAAPRPGAVAPSRGSTSIFIHPPYRFRAVDALLTNFHLPRSTLLALVMAFAGVDLTRRAYAHAISQGYRFYSFGDATFIA